MSYKREEFELEGVKWRMKKTSAANLRKLNELGDLEGVEDMDNGEQALITLKTIAEPIEGDPESIDPEEVDIRAVEHYFANFLPRLSGM